MSHQQSLAAHFEALELPTDAAVWLLNLWDVIQVLDDLHDGDEVAKPDLMKTIWRVLVSMPANPFYRVHESVLTPVVANSILKWNAANQAELEGTHDEVSFVWRSSYYDVVLVVVSLCHGPDRAFELSRTVMGLYGEKYADYRKEF